jgi:cation:H+ antiporter
LTTAALILGGLVLLAIGGEILIRGAVGLAHLLRWSPLVIGIIVVGFGTSIAEMFVSVRAVLDRAPDLAVGNAFGSNISNILLVLALGALMRPIEKPSRLLVPDAFVLVPVTIGVVLLGLQGEISTWQSAGLLALLFGLIFLEFRAANRKAQWRRENEELLDLPDSPPQTYFNASVMIGLGLIGLAIGAELLVRGAIDAARMLGVSEALIGLTIVAIGTSLPELAGTVAAARHGHTKVIYGNVVGSNLFNLLGALGAAGVAGTLTVSWSLAAFDGSIMILATMGMILLIWKGRGLSRLDGLLLFAAYVIYIGVRTWLSVSGAMDV